MKISTIATVLTAALSCASCTSSRSTVSEGIDLSGYKYASVINNDTWHIPADLMPYQIKLFDAIGESRLELVADYRILNLSPEEQGRLLLVKYGVTPGNNDQTVTVNFIDFLSGRPVVSCSGSYGLSLSDGGDIEGAIDKVKGEIVKVFNKK